MTTLTTEEIILMWQYTRFERNNIEEFARMVEAKATERAREACAKVCDEYAKDSDWPTADNCAEAIRARGEPTSRGNT